MLLLMCELHADNAGHLVYLGGLGLSKCVANAANPRPEVISGFDDIDWVDDTSDGSVSVRVTNGTFR
jgi:L-Lysine epsilon oxidase N-terminal